MNNFGWQSKSCCVFYFLILFVVCGLSYVQAMDRSAKPGPILDARAEVLQDLLDKKRPFVVNKQSCISKKKSFGRIISLADVCEVEYLNDHRIAITMDTKKHHMIDLCSNEQWEFSKPFMTLKCTMSTSESTEKVLNWGPDGCADIRMHEGFPYNKRNDYAFDYNRLFLPLYLDENQSPLIWVNKDTYHYTKSSNTHLFCSDVNIYESVFNSSLDPDGIISQCKEKFTTYYDLKQLLFSDPFTRLQGERMYLYSRNRHCIIRCISQSHNNIDGSILYLDKEDINNFRIKNLSAIPCSMILNPVNKDIFALMLAADRTIQYRNFQGVLVAEQKSPTAHLDNIEKKLSDFGKYLSFSPDGTHLAAVFPEKKEIVIFNVPLRVQIDPKKLIFILFCLKHQQLLPKDIVMHLNDIFCA